MINFQVVDWNESDLLHERDEEAKFTPREVLFRAYGRTESGESVCCSIVGFEPYFYVRMPDGITERKMRFELEKLFQSEIWKDDFGRDMFGKFWFQYIIEMRMIRGRDLYWFSNNTMKRYMMIKFTSVRAYSRAKRFLEHPDVSFKFNKKKWNTRKLLYESNVTPLLRFFHLRDIEPAGWISVPMKKGVEISTCDHNLRCMYDEVESMKKTDMAPFRICSFDIECTSGDGSFPQPERESDKVIQIGSTFHRYGERECYRRWIVVLGESEDIENADVYCVNSEKQVILEWARLVQKEDIDVITGYNIWGFDFRYLYERALNGCGGKCAPFVDRFLKYLTKSINYPARYVIKDLSSSALGKNILYYVEGEGIVGIDLFKVIQRDHNLSSFKLDNVSSHFIRGSIKSVSREDDLIVLETDNLDYLQDRTWISIDCAFSREQKVKQRHSGLKGLDKKYQIFETYENKIYVSDCDLSECFADESICEEWMSGKIKSQWYQNKVDLSPRELFSSFERGTKEDIKNIAVYCLKDCELVNFLIMKLEVIANNIGMANVCIVPFSYLFVRGQGIKIFSLVAKQCAKEGFIVPVIRAEDTDEGTYEGAIVFMPKPDIYFEPVAVMDFASLYPSSMIAENISHETLVIVEDYDMDGNIVRVVGDRALLDLPEYNYNIIEYDNYVGKGDEKTKCGIRKCYFAESKDGSKGLMPRILQHLLFARRSTRASANYYHAFKRDGTEIEGFYRRVESGHQFQKYKEDPIVIADEDLVGEPKEKYNEFQKAILDGLQLAYKVTCNSLYGQLGASTSPICMKELAASTTAVGRDMARKARDYTLEMYPGSRLIYGDTDSVFISFKDYIENKYGKIEDWEEMLRLSIECGKEAGDYVTSKLKRPQELEYEKTFYPFVIFTKKRYFGNKYELSTKKYKQTSMGIVLKRRDNAPIVKDIYHGVIDFILNHKDIEKAKEFFRSQVSNLLLGNVDIKDLIITKTLGSDYADPTTIAHNVMAMRMAMRDPGNRPQVNDRLPYCFIESSNYKCRYPGCSRKINEKDCKCRSCQSLFCKMHLERHHDYCEHHCRFTGKTISDEDLLYCETCQSYYTKESYEKHNIRNDRKRGMIFHDRCKKLTSRRLLQGDLIEHPSYIMENKLKIDYRYYYDHQVENPVMQIFELTMDNPKRIVEDILREDDHRKSGSRSITSFFKKL